MKSTAMVWLPVLPWLLGLPGLVESFTKCCRQTEVIDLITKECVPDIRTGRANWNGSSEISLNITRLAGRADPSDFQFSWDVAVAYKKLGGQNCSAASRLNLLDFNVFLGRKFQFVVDTNSEAMYKQYCFDHALNPETGVLAPVCQVCLDCSPEVPCISFCCGAGEEDVGGRCAKGAPALAWPAQPYSRVVNKLHCSVPREIPQFQPHRHGDGGRLVVDTVNRDVSEYCINQMGVNMSVLLCPKEGVVVSSRSMLKVVCSFCSLASLFFLMLVHLAFKELYRNHFCKLQIFLFTCLLAVYLLLIISNLRDFIADTASCLVIALGLQYFGLATFCWLTSLSVDIWIKFRKFENPMQDMEKREEKQKRLCILYCLFSFGSPVIVTAVTLALQLLEQDTSDIRTPARLTGVFSSESSSAPPLHHYVHPGIGESSCFLNYYLPQLLYFHALVAALLVWNILLYLLLLYSFYFGVWAPAANSFRPVQTLVVMLKLLVVMGLNWISEVLSFVLVWQNLVPPSSPLLVFFDVMNLLTGVFLLITFLSKRHHRELLMCAVAGSKEESTGRTLSTQISKMSEVESLRSKMYALETRIINTFFSTPSTTKTTSRPASESDVSDDAVMKWHSSGTFGIITPVMVGLEYSQHHSALHISARLVADSIEKTTSEGIVWEVKARPGTGSLWGEQLAGSYELVSLSLQLSRGENSPWHWVRGPRLSRGELWLRYKRSPSNTQPTEWKTATEQPEQKAQSTAWMQEDKNGNWEKQEKDDEDQAANWEEQEDDDEDQEANWEEQEDDDQDQEANWKEQEEDDEDQESNWEVQEVRVQFGDETEEEDEEDERHHDNDICEGDLEREAKQVSGSAWEKEGLSEGNKAIEGDPSAQRGASKDDLTVVVLLQPKPDVKENRELGKLNLFLKTVQHQQPTPLGGLQLSLAKLLPSCDSYFSCCADETTWLVYGRPLQINPSQFRVLTLQ